MTVPELIVRSSIQIFLANKEHPQPEGFGSGCILYHRDKYFLLSVRHVTEDYYLKTFLETGIESEKDGQPGSLLQPIGGLCYFDLFNVADVNEIRELNDMFKGGNKLDITFAEIKHNIELRQPELDFKAFKIEAGYKVILDSREIAKPGKDKTYGFLEE